MKEFGLVLLVTGVIVVVIASAISSKRYKQSRKDLDEFINNCKSQEEQEIENDEEDFSKLVKLSLIPMKLAGLAISTIGFALFFLSER